MSSQQSNQHVARYKGYRPEIDGLRAIAVLAVIANHFNKNSIPSGHLGVDIFFVISGFVITSSLSRQKHSSFRQYLLSFYTRRIKRLLPALSVFCLAIGVLICLFNPIPSDAIRAGIAALFGVSNIYFFNESTNYFARAAEQNPYTHTWSLGVEEQFYIFFPFLAWFTGFSCQKENGPKKLTLLISALSLVSLVSFLILCKANQPAAFFLVTSRFWELGAGCLLFLITHTNPSAKAAIQRIPPILPLLAIIALLFSVAKAKEIIALVIATCILIGCLKPGTKVYSLLTNKRIVGIGLLSYSLYLWHWGVLAISRWTIGVHAWTIPIQIAAMAILSLASYQLIEQPLRIRQWSTKPLFTVAYGLGANSATASLLALIGFNPAFHLYTGRSHPLFQEKSVALTAPYSLSSKQGISTWNGEDCMICNGTDTSKTINPSNCTLGDINLARKRILIAGNSFAATFTSGFDQLIDKDNYAVIITSSAGSSPSPGLTTDRDIFQAMSDHYWQTIFPRTSAVLKPGDWVFLASDVAYFTPLTRHPEDDNKLRDLKISLERLSDKLSQRGVKLAMLHGLPYARDAQCNPAVGMRQWFNSIGKGPCTFYSKSETIARRKPLDDALRELEKRKKLVVVDLLPVFCQFTICSYDGPKGTLLYRDEVSHPSADAIRISAPLLRRIFLQAQ